MKEWYLTDNYKPTVTSGYESDAISEFAESNFTDVTETDFADRVLLCNSDLSDCKEIRTMGGGAASPLWCQIKEDMTNRRIVTLENEETACLGSAIIAGSSSLLQAEIISSSGSNNSTNDIFFITISPFKLTYKISALNI